jgi:hypothetical protein
MKNHNDRSRHRFVDEALDYSGVCSGHAFEVEFLGQSMANFGWCMLPLESCTEASLVLRKSGVIKTTGLLF